MEKSSRHAGLSEIFIRFSLGVKMWHFINVPECGYPVIMQWHQFTGIFQGGPDSMFYSRFLSSFCKNCRLCFLLFWIKMCPKKGDEESPISSRQRFMLRGRISEIAIHNFSTELSKGFCF